MEFVEHMIFVCFALAAVGFVLGVPCFIMEKLADKFNLTDKIVSFFTEDDEE